MRLQKVPFLLCHFACHFAECSPQLSSADFCVICCLKCRFICCLKCRFCELSATKFPCPRAVAVYQFTRQTALSSTCRRRSLFKRRSGLCAVAVLSSNIALVYAPSPFSLQTALSSTRRRRFLFKQRSRLRAVAVLSSNGALAYAPSCNYYN